jgi:hypothetical protein
LGERPSTWWTDKEPPPSWAAGDFRDDRAHFGKTMPLQGSDQLDMFIL